MPGTQVPEKKRRQAVARILNGQSSPKDEAIRLGKDERTVERWVSLARGAVDAAKGAPSVSATSPSPVPLEAAKGSNPALDAARAAAAGATTGTSSVTPTPMEAATAREDMAKFCLDQVGQLKGAVGSAIVTFKYSPPLDLSDPEVQKVLALSPTGELAIRANAERLYPMLVKMMSGPYQIFAALALEAVMMFVGLRSLAGKQGWQPAPKKSEDNQERDRKPKAVGGSPMSLREQIEKQREALGKPTLQALTPDTSSPTTGTINAPAA